jgi:methylthioribose-1-phosphate isomerase
MNGDVANKIGTYTIAVVAHENGVPFHVAAPISTVDPALETGERIPIEERSPDEVLHWSGVATAPEGMKAANPAFDVTPNRFVSAIITERGVALAPYTKSLKLMVEQSQ